MTESDYRWLANDNLPGQTIRVVAGSEWHYAQGGWHETDPEPELTAADIEAAQAEAKPPVHDVLVLSVEPAPELEYTDPSPGEEPQAELADDEQEPDTETPAEEES